MTPQGDERMSTERRNRLRRIASGIVRDWARRDLTAITAEIEAVGRSAVETSAREVARLPTQDGESGSDGLSMLGVVVDAIGRPPRKRWSLFRDRSTTGTMPIPRLAAIIENERDAAMRRVMTLRRDRLRLGTVDGSLEEALDLIALLESGAVAVAREISVTDPTRAVMLRTEVAAALSVRDRDLRLQLIVLRQASATLDLVTDGQTALVDALDRARNITIGAARTAVAARRVIGADVLPSDGRAGRAASLGSVVARLNAAVDRRERD